MLKRVITSIRHLGHHATGFDSYYSGLQRHHLSGTPSFEEARKDYRSALHNETTGYMG